MAYTTRKVPDSMIFALVAAYNARQEASVGSEFHADVTQTTDSSDYKSPTVAAISVTAANATDSPTAITLVNEIKSDYDLHVADTYAHDTAVSPAITVADATDEATAITLANNVKSVYNTHLSASNVHFNNDATNDVTNANATDSATLVTLVNEIKGDFNAHIASAPVGNMIQLVDA